MQSSPETIRRLLLERQGTIMCELYSRGTAQITQHIIDRTGTSRTMKTVAKDKEILDGANQRILRGKEDILKIVTQLQKLQERLDDSHSQCIT
jgi:hypothetical protein